jgi:hypothetical protein
MPELKITVVRSDWECLSVVGCLPSRHEALNLILSTTTTKHNYYICSSEVWSLVGEIDMLLSITYVVVKSQL